VLSASDSYEHNGIAYFWCSNHALLLCTSGDKRTANTGKVRV
jgi:hypothetical protein